jgi:hypothetical protein
MKQMIDDTKVQASTTTQIDPLPRPMPETLSQRDQAVQVPATVETSVKDSIPTPESATPVSNPEVPVPTAIARKIEINIQDDGQVNLNLTGNFKTYEFYGVLLTIFMDVAAGNFKNDLVQQVAKLMPSTTSDEKIEKLKAGLVKTIQDTLAGTGG